MVANQRKLKAGGILGISFGTWWHMVANSSEVGAKIGEAGAKLVASCNQDGPRYL